MKTTPLILLVLSAGLGLLQAQTPPRLRPVPQRSSVPATTAAAGAATNAAARVALPSLPAPAGPAVSPPPAASPASTAASEEMVPAGDINFQGVDVNQVLEVYARYVGRTLLRANLPQAKIVLKTETPLTKNEVVQALQGVLALNGIALINVGSKFVKAVPAAQAGQEAAPFNNEPASELPDVGQYVTRIVQLHYVKPSTMVPILQPFAKLQNSILAIDSNGILVLRDDAENVKRMLEMIKRVDVPVPDEFISEVIPIKYAMVDDIANALNSLGGTSTAIGSSTAPTPVSGMPGGQTGINQRGINQPNQQRPFGTSPGTTTSGSTFSQRLQSIIQRASTESSGQIQILGPTKIIADERSNSLLVFATRRDMKTIKEIVSKLDVLLPQVLIEAVIMDYSLGPNTLNFGISAAQEPQTYSPSFPAVSGGGMNNGAPLPNFLAGVGITNFYRPFASASTNLFPSGLSYFGNIGPNWDVALQAMQADSHVTIIQRPRIQTSQAKPAQFFVGQTIPYVNSVYYNSGIGAGASSSYSQLSVGVELDVTPFINPNGLVVMDINQEIDDVVPGPGLNVGGGVSVPETDKRTLSSEVAVKDGDAVMLGGFISSSKSKSRSGIPLLMDIPVLGNLFSSRSDSKQRSELIVLIRPTVLRTPESAAVQAIREEKSLPGISAAMAEDEAEQRKAEQAFEKQRRSQSKSQDGFFQSLPPTDLANTNNAGF